jgi:hypothetical protein
MGRYTSRLLWNNLVELSGIGESVCVSGFLGIMSIGYLYISIVGSLHKLLQHDAYDSCPSNCIKRRYYDDSEEHPFPGQFSRVKLGIVTPIWIMLVSFAVYAARTRARLFEI